MTRPAYSTETKRETPSPAKHIRAVAAAKTVKKTSTKIAGASTEMLVHPESPDVEVTIEYVTPEVAKHFLTKLPDWQRNESLPTIDEYTDDMIDEDWMFTGDPMRFTGDDEFFDGQHRAQSIVASGKPQWVVIVRGLPREVMRVLDTGYQRKFTNYLSTRKVPNIQSVSNLTAKILDWRRGNYAHPTIARVPGARYINAKKSHQKLIHTFHEMEDEIINAVREGNYIRGKFPRSAPSTVYSFAHLYLNRLDVYKCAQFFDELTGKVAQASTDTTYPIRALEKTLTSRAGEKGLASYTYLGWVFRAWDEWLAEQPLSRDQFRNIKKPRWNSLVIPTDPNAASRPEGWEPL